MTHHNDVATTSRRRATLAGARMKDLARPRAAVGFLAVGAFAVVLAACGSTPSSSATTAGNTGTTASSSSTSAPSATATVKSASSSQFGTILENSSGMALYTYGPNNSGTTNMCTGACLMAWPAVTVAAGTTPTLASGVPGTLGTAKQADGTAQVTYNGQLLYTFVSDTPGPGDGERRGQVQRGQGVGVDDRCDGPDQQHTRHHQGAHDDQGAHHDRGVGRGLPVLIRDTIENLDGRGDTSDMVTPGSPTEPPVADVSRPAENDDPVSESADAAGLRVAFLTHGGELYGYARRSLGDPRAAEDVVQETFIRAWRARNRFDTNLGTLRTWLFTIARRVVIDHARARAIRQTEPLPTDMAGIDDDVENAMVGWQMEEALKRLRPDHRQVLIETYYRGRSGREVAEELGIPEGTVRSRLFYGLRTLRLALEEMGWDR